MPLLYRCRTSLSEVGAIISAAPPPRADWSAELRPGRTGLIVRTDEDSRRIEAMRWGLPGQDTRATLWYRDWRTVGADIRDPHHRCLIVVDSFALPDGAPGRRTRTWYGYDDVPIFAWAGFWTADAGAAGFCGFQLSVPVPLSSGRVMPAIALPKDHELWLRGDWREASMLVRCMLDEDALYREPTEQPW